MNLLKNFIITNCNMRAAFIVIYLSVFFNLNIPSSLADDWSASCSSNCTCKWTNGKKSAICSSLELTTIPTTLSTEIQVLVLNDNNIIYLNREEFQLMGYLNLQRIYLKKSNVQYIHKETFKNLKILVEIDLSDNNIEQIDKDTFIGNDRLRILYLNGNPIKKLISYQFPVLPHLRTLDLHNCLINYIDPLTFANLNLLEFLYLKNNLLENLSEYVFQHMTNLKTLVLDDNPWQCNCKLRNFRNWYIKSKLNSISLTCKGPFNHKSKNWENIDELQFGCSPKVDIFSADDLQNIDIGTNTTFSCLIYGDPLPDITWELNGKNFDNDNIMLEQEILTSDKLWSNLTVFNMTSLDAGTYSCAAQNLIGTASQNISIYLTEIVQHVLVKTPETFWYFGLIMGTFGTVFLLILLSFVVCLCKRQTRRRRHPNKNIKGSVSFNDQEKKLLDLSITTTNDRGDSCGIDNNTPSINKTESVIGFEPIEITVENRGNGGGINNVAGNCMVNVNANNSVICSGVAGIGQNSLVLINNQQQHQQKQIPSCSNSGGVGGGGIVALNNNPSIPEEFPLNVGVFPPPPEFCSNVVTNPAYGNIFISVSVTQDMLDSSDINIYPDLLNIPKRVVDNISSSGSTSSSGGASNSSAGTIVPVNVSSFATLPRNHQRRGILKKDTNLYPHDEIVSYHNLDTSYRHPPPPPSLAHIHEQQQQHLQQHPTRGGGKSSIGTTCINCMKAAQQHPYSKDDINTTQMPLSPPLPPQQTQITCVNSNCSAGVNNQCSLSRQSSLQQQQQQQQQQDLSPSNLSSCLNYDNMGRRITASGNSTLSLPDEEEMENERLYNENQNSCSGGNSNNPLRNFVKQHPVQNQQQLPLPPQSASLLSSTSSSSTSTSTTTTSTTTTQTTATQSTQSDCLQQSSPNDFVSL